MSDRFTDNIEPFALASHGRTFEGKVPLAELGRLLPLVRSTGGEAEFALHFGVDEGGVPCVGGQVKATLVLQCQRCMEEMTFPVSIKVQLGLVTSREAAERLPDSYEPLVVTGDEISIASIVEDELILALPIVAMHEIEDCPQGVAFLAMDKHGPDQDQDNILAPKRENPFAVLAKLKEYSKEPSLKEPQPGSPVDSMKKDED